ncbi:hypothetical protein MSSAC_3716 [Methanosarcina siciliae C2J]|uniref:DUF2178 domain-containing protein n=3 Tax=Methanosarcina siciliae TaxID=38027 RepID=A0A0E3PHI0_9EURY|nr:DUF2178 domain-containing protein [Methanosarcina siciliae]AKB30042.1 hypothetical protein MSSIT_3323 [Methanosarcina siciliae T4/M]AKB33942.1 hypothetical protein MSSIH_3252 [Methanosarcina siciliae HI350]AKB38306.1 hypothetical protein MSSAC_3716 [Methanosarcina siciliae C2J]
MKRKQFRIISLLITMIMGAVVGFSVSIGNPVLTAGVVLAGMAAMYNLKSRLEGVVEDERIYQISQKASRITLQIMALGLALGGTVLIAMRKAYPGYTDLGFFMAYASCGILVLYSLFYRYYNKESGG